MTVVYSLFPAGCTLEQAKGIRTPTSRTLNKRDKYPALPWSMEELVGSDWRNIYICKRERALRIGYDHWKRPCLVSSDHDPGQREVVLSLGLWWNERYVLEHEVRVDTLPPEIEMQYALDELAQLVAASEHNKAAWFMEEVEEARGYAVSFAQKHNLPVPDVKNSGRRQMVLF